MRPGLRKTIDVCVVMCTILLSTRYAIMFLRPFLTGSAARRVPLPCRRIAAVYIAARLYQLEEAKPLHEKGAGAPLEKLSEYFRYDATNPVPKEIIPDLNHYELDPTFLSDSPPTDATTVVIVAKAPDKKTNARLVVLADGTIKAVRSTQALVAKRLADIADPVFDVTPEKGIIVAETK